MNETLATPVTEEVNHMRKHIRSYASIATTIAGIGAALAALGAPIKWG